MLQLLESALHYWKNFIIDCKIPLVRRNSQLKKNRFIFLLLKVKTGKQKYCFNGTIEKALKGIW